MKTSIRRFNNIYKIERMLMYVYIILFIYVHLMHDIFIYLLIFFRCIRCRMCYFCNEFCEVRAWLSYHQWDCYGLQSHIWYPEDMDYAVMRMMFYGFWSTEDIPFYTGGEQFSNNYYLDTKSYGDVESNYKYIFKLQSDVRRKSLTELQDVLKVYYSSTFLDLNFIYIISEIS